MNRRFEAPGEVVRRRGSLLLTAAGVWGVATALHIVGALPPWGALVEQGLAMALLVAFAMNQWRERRRGTVRADADGLWLDGARIASRRRIGSAYLLSFDTPVVRVHCRRALPFDVRLDDDEAARALLDALGFGIGQSIAAFRVFYGGRRGYWEAVVAAAIIAGVMGGLGGALGHRAGLLRSVLVMSAVLSVGALFLYVRTSARLEVGSDGLLVRRPGRHEFIPYGQLQGVSLDENDIVLTTPAGECVRVTTGTSTAQLEMRDALVRRIQEAREAFARGHAAGSVAALVAPGGRPVERWLHDLRHLTDVRDYREATLDRDRLWDLLDDPSVPAATRAGAAVALAAGDDPDARARLRVAAEACAEPQLRITLACVAEGAEEPELEAMLESLVRSGE
jgi:phage shock protein PspC (stress-responsive transcriptional regulator)